MKNNVRDEPARPSFPKASDQRPLTAMGLWSLAFGNDGLAGSSRTLFFTAGPHTWIGATEQSVHGLLGAIEPA